MSWGGWFGAWRKRLEADNETVPSWLKRTMTESMFLIERRAWARMVMGVGLLTLLMPMARAEDAWKPLARGYEGEIRPLLKQYCLGCHSAEKHKGSLNLERFDSLRSIRQDLKPWQQVMEMVESGEMPPEDKAQPTEGERGRLREWLHRYLNEEAAARAGDPGEVPLRRLSNAEYEYTVRGLIGVELGPTREFPVDGAGGEGFTNAAESLSEMSPALMKKYMAAAKEIAAHAVMLPAGIRFSVNKTRRDWTDESIGRLREFYGGYSKDGRLPVQPYLLATVRYRERLLDGTTTLEKVAAGERLHLKYLRILWQAMTDQGAAFPMDDLAARWKKAGEGDVAGLVAQINGWQELVWKIVKVGSYREPVRQVANEPAAGWEKKGNLPAAPPGVDGDRLKAGFAAFRECFPMFICYPQIIPVDEVVCLKQYHRDDEPLVRLFLNEAERRELDGLWEEHRFISQWPIAEEKYLPLFIGFVTQDQPKEMVTYFEAMREPFHKRAVEFQREIDAGAQRELEWLIGFAGRAYRRPLTGEEAAGLRAFYEKVQQGGASGDEAMRSVLARILMSPSFLFHIEQAPAGSEPREVSDWELASRLSYFLWSSEPDEALREAAAKGTLHETAMLEQQAQRMLRDGRVRGLATEFGTQWIHVRGFDQLKEKNEKLFPAFDQNLKSAMYEEAIRLFAELFQQDRQLASLIDSDGTSLNETLAKHYGIPGVAGREWREVTGVRKYGRGGVLGLGCVQAQQAGASRTSPILRGNWVLETLLGEKLPRPPADVPRLPESEVESGGLTMRQIVEQHTKVASCAVCHRRMDPIGFALERYDAIGRLRSTDAGGATIDCHSKLMDGTELEGLDGLRKYLVEKKKEVIERLFCRRLAGYALGRATAVSDQLLIDEMVAALRSGDDRVSAAVMTLVKSKQFRSIRGRDFAGVN
jgi:hypothetical protein